MTARSPPKAPAPPEAEPSGQDCPAKTRRQPGPEEKPAEPPMVVVREGWWSRKVAERPREVLRREDEGKKR